MRGEGHLLGYHRNKATLRQQQEGFKIDKGGGRNPEGEGQAHVTQSVTKVSISGFCPLLTPSLDER